MYIYDWSSVDQRKLTDPKKKSSGSRTKFKFPKYFILCMVSIVTVLHVKMALHKCQHGTDQGVEHWKPNIRKILNIG